jgi:hypothetical protein
MNSAFVVIDTFEVKERDTATPDSLPCGIWNVLEGSFVSAEQLPQIGSEVRITEPDGNTRSVVVSGLELRHGSAAISITSVENAYLPRFSRITV